MIRHVLFDLDGTLTDSADGITRCLAHAVLSLDAQAPPPHVLASHIGSPLDEIFGTLLETRDAGRIQAAIVAYRERFDRCGYAENRVYDGVAELLEQLRERGYALYVATAKRESDAVRVARHLGLERWFDGVHGVRNEAERRDKARLVARILAGGAIDPAQAAMVGDRSHDMLGATRNGLLAIGAGWGYGSADELSSSGARWISPDPLALLEHLLPLPG